MLSIKTTKKVKPEAVIKRKTAGLFAYVKHAAIGGCMAVMSFTTALAMQPSVGAEDINAVYADGQEVTMEDIAILESYMDSDILSDIMETEDIPYEIVMKYSDRMPDFVAVRNNYFGW